MTLLNDRTQLSIVVVGALLVADFVLFGVRPSQQRLESLHATRAQQESVVCRADVHRRHLPALRADLVTSDQALAQVEDRIPSNARMGAFLQEFSALMARYRLEDRAVIPGPERAVDGLHCVPIVVQCKGLLPDLVAFFQEVPSIRRAVQLESIRFTHDPALTGQVRMDVQMAIFYRLRG